MSRKPDKKRRIPTEGGGAFGQNPFGDIGGSAMPHQYVPPLRDKEAAKPDSRSDRKKGRLTLRREKADRGGKTVTVIEGEDLLVRERAEDLAFRLRKHCGSGGTSRKGCIELQGDHREKIAVLLEEEGYRVTRSGG